MKALEFLYFWLYPENEGRQKLLVPEAPVTPRKTSATSGSGDRSKLDGDSKRITTDTRLRAMLEYTHDGWSPQTPSKPSRTFESTQLALSRSAAVAGISPRKRTARVSFDAEEEANNIFGSHQTKRASLQTESPGKLSATKQPRSPDGPRRSVLATSAFRISSRSNLTPPTTPGDRNVKSHRRPSSLGHGRLKASIAEDRTHIFKPPRPPLSPSKGSEFYPASHGGQTSGLAASTPSKDPQRHISIHAEDVPCLRTSIKPHREHLSTIGDLPGSSGHTKGLFASTLEARLHPASGVPERSGGRTFSDAQYRDSTRDRRRLMLGKYIGNVDQLLERFDGLRCSGS